MIRANEEKAVQMIGKTVVAIDGPSQFAREDMADDDHIMEVTGIEHTRFGSLFILKSRNGNDDFTPGLMEPGEKGIGYHVIL